MVLASFRRFLAFVMVVLASTLSLHVVTPDGHRVNVEERVRVYAPHEGTWELEVWAYAAPLDNVEFALAVTGAVEASDEGGWTP